MKNLQSHDEIFILRMANCDMLKPKLVVNDEEVFDNILSSVFNDGLQGDGSDLNEQIDKAKQERQETLRNEAKQIIEMKKLAVSQFLINKVVQLYNNMQLKHGLMLVGSTLGGKTTTLELLKKLNEVQKLKHKKINKKKKKKILLISKLEEFSQYHDGLLPFHLKDISNTRYDGEKTRVVKWLVLDSSIDTL